MSEDRTVYVLESLKRYDPDAEWEKQQLTFSMGCGWAATMYKEQAEVYLKDLRENYPDATFPHNNELRIQDYIPASELEKLREELKGVNVACEGQEEVTLQCMEMSKRQNVTIDNLKVEIERIKYDGPQGSWMCDYCDLFIVSQVINVQQGTVGIPRIQKIPDCSSGCGPMRPLTWKEAAANQNEGFKRLNKVIDEREKERDKWANAAKANYNACGKLQEEINRLKKGEFTKAEIHNFCHSLNENVSREEFEKACKEYQDSLYGDKDTPDNLVRINIDAICVMGHEYRTSLDTPGNCWCGALRKT